MRTPIWSVITTIFLGLSCLAQPPQAVKLKRLDLTADPLIDSGFSFNISPDDQWVVFFKRDDPEASARPEVHHLYGHLRVMNLRSGQVHSFTLAEEQAAMYPMDNADASWAPDSSMCVLPPPRVEDRRVVIRFPKGEKPTVSFLPHPRHPRKPGEPPPEEQIKMPERFACSDCFPHDEDFDLLRKHIPKEMLFVGSVTPNERARQMVSPDGTKIYYQKGPQGKQTTPEGYEETTLFEIDASTGKERTLATYRGECPMIDQLRCSPDGKKLAYQVTMGCGSVDVPEIYVLDLKTAMADRIAHGIGPMHWSSASDRLFFYRRWLEGNHVDHLWVAEFEKPKPAQTQP